MVSSPICLACKGTITEGEDTFVHRSLYCCKVQKLGEVESYRWVREIAAGYNEGSFSEFWGQWLKTGLRHPPCLPTPRADSEHVQKGELKELHGCTAFLDGSTYNGRWREVARSGWGLVIMENCDNVLGGREVFQAYGTYRGQGSATIELRSMPYGCCREL